MNSKLFYQIIILLVFCLFIFSLPVNAYKVESGTEVHQHITNESRNVWKLLPYELKQHLKNPITRTTSDNEYNGGDDIIDGSREEDLPLLQFKYLRHFWEPDFPDYGLYSYGWSIIHRSSYRKAMEYWKTKVIPLYLEGKENESYYWLGRVAHLLEDATVPAHMHRTSHTSSESLEYYSGNNFQNWKGVDYEGKQYNYESLNNTQTLNWKEIEPTRVPDKNNLELFRLFWYTAQKTQYYADDVVNGNSVYENLSNNQKPFSTSLWQGDNVLIINNTNDVSANISKIANATIPHAMKATAGLYRLFWDAVHVDWPTYHHDYRRTGFTLLKGDLTSSSQVRKTEWTLDNSNVGSAIDHPSIGDLDRNGKQEIVVTTSKYTSPYNGTVYSVEKGWSSFSQKWKNNIGEPIPKAPSLADIDTDKYMEVSFGERAYGKNSSVYVLDGYTGNKQWNYTMKEKWSPYMEIYMSGLVSNTALVDIDLDGEKEVLFTDKTDSACDWPGELFAFDRDGGTTPKYNITVGNDGSEGGVSIADIFGSDYPDVIVPTKCGIKAYEFDGSKFVLKWSNTDARIDANAVIYDVDRDNKYEIIYTTTNASCPSGKSCDNQLYIRDAETGNNEAISPIDLGTYVSKVTPAIANIIGDNNVEILITARDSSSSNYGRVLCYYSNNGSACGYNWPYTGGGTLNTLYQAPVIADIDNDGKYNIIFGTGTLENKTYFLKENGDLLFSYKFDGQLGSSPAIGDIDGDGMAEIAVRHEGSNILTELSGLNRQPQLNNISNISAKEGDLINVNASGEVLAIDEDNQTLTYYYSSPFNESGYWQTDCDSSGNYSILIEVSDGNLSDWQYISVEVNENCSSSTTSNISISSLTNITINNTHMVFQFIINNTGTTTLNNINWTLDAGDGSSVIKSAETFSLASGSSAFIFVEYNYSTESNFVVNATANSGTLTASKNLSINLGNATPSNLDVYDFSMYNVSSTHKVFSFMVKNIAENQNLTDISWSLNTGIETIDSDPAYSFNLTPNNFSFVFVAYNYTQTGDFTPVASATSGANQDSETLPTIDIPDIEASNLSLIYNATTHRIFFFTITNMLSTPLTNVNWTFDTDDEDNVITSNQLFSLNASKESWVFVEYNYSTTGTYTVNATAINGSLKDSTYYEFTIN